MHIVQYCNSHHPYKKGHYDHYNLSDYERCWDALFLMIDLFRKTAVYVADKLNFTYNTEDDKNVYAYLRHIKNLPANAKTLYEER